MKLPRFWYAVVVAAVVLIGFVLGQHVPPLGFMFGSPPPFVLDQFPDGLDTTVT